MAVFLIIGTRRNPKAASVFSRAEATNLSAGVDETFDRIVRGLQLSGDELSDEILRDYVFFRPLGQKAGVKGYPADNAYFVLPYGRSLKRAEGKHVLALLELVNGNETAPNSTFPSAFHFPFEDLPPCFRRICSWKDDFVEVFTLKRDQLEVLQCILRQETLKRAYSSA